MAEKKVVPAEPQQAPGTAVVDYQAELAALTAATTAAEKPTGNWVSFKSGVLAIGGNPMKDNKAPVVIVYSAFENQWYKERYDANNPTSPHCYALGETDDDLRPHPDAAEPQAATCAECPKNEWKSDPNGGKGKWCKNVRRLAMVSAGDLDNLQRAEVAVAKLPVTSVKNWSTFANQIANVLKVPPLGVIAEMSVVPDAKTQFQVNFELIDKVPQEYLPALLEKRREVHPLIFAAYDPPTEAVAAGAKKY